MTTVIEALSSVPAVLVARTVKVKDPADDGVPDTSPDELLKVNPVGREPDCTENVGAGLPVAVNVYVYAVPTVPVVGGVSFTRVGAVAGGGRR